MPSSLARCQPWPLEGLLKLISSRWHNHMRSTCVDQGDCSVRVHVHLQGAFMGWAATYPDGGACYLNYKNKALYSLTYDYLCTSEE